MLSLREIVKTYVTGDTAVHALGGVSIDFRESEFVSILGPSGCGKTTLLNVIGGLDRYDSGDLVINGRSTKEYRDADWDTYRNHSIGFVFQSYNLITHQTVLSNVELALTLSGVSREERRARAIEALEKVGLGDQIHKKPNQMSGGQMQRVAIARALVNDPDILLADEPTGALDTATSVQVMDILREVAKEKLVIMVTHNPELAAEYSTRIIRLKDGRVTDDSNPFAADTEQQTAENVTENAITGVENVDTAVAEVSEKRSKKAKKNADGKGKRSMSFLTALSLSLNNLMTKKTRTLLVSIAGSIGIIGIALILALSNGVNLFIASVQENALSSYPLTIQKQTQDMSAMLGAMMQTSDAVENRDPNKIYVDDSMGTMMSAMSATVENNLKAFKAYIEANPEKLEGHLNDIRYTYDFDLQIFTADGKTQVNPTEIFNNMGESFAGVGDLMGGMGVMSEMINNQQLLEQQYELVGENSRWPTDKSEVVLVVNSNNQISKMTLYMLGVLDQGELEQIMKDLMTKGEYDTTPLPPYELDHFLGMTFKLLNTSDFFKKTDKKYTVDGKEYSQWYDVREVGFDQESFVKANGMDLKIVGIVRPQKGATATSISGAIGYTKALTDHILEQNAKSEIINQQKNLTPNHSVLNGAPFARTPYTRENIGDLIDRVGTTNMQRFYGIMTAMILQDPQYAGLLSVTPQSISGFIATMELEAQREKIAGMLENATSTFEGTPMNAMAFKGLMAMLKQIPGGLSSVDLTADNLLDLLPLLSTEQVVVLVGGMPASETMPAMMGLKDLCTADYMTALYATMNEEMKSWQINEKSLALVMGQMDDAMFEKFEQTLYDMVPDKDATLDSNLKLLGDAEKADPASINFYAVDFESKEYIQSFIDEYNASVEEKDRLEYTDLVGTLMSSVTIIVDAISYVLIAFVSISLVVSSIMIGIITYISVLERTKEIGILRAIGASKKDISRVFNAETMIIGFAAGAIGILATLLFCIPINLILRAVTDMNNIKAVLPVGAAFILIAISMVLTLIAGLIPSRIASKKDPVVALRTE
jgi:putative ABC transport system permease protein